MRQGAVDDGVGTDIEQAQIDIAEQPPQIERALRMAKRDVQDLMCDQPCLLGQAETIEHGAIEHRVAVGHHRRRVAAGQILVSNPGRQPAGGRREFHHALDRADAAVIVLRAGLSHRRRRDGGARHSDGTTHYPK